MVLVDTIMGKTVHFENGYSNPITWIWRDGNKVTCKLGGNTNERKDIELGFHINQECENWRIVEMVKELLPFSHLPEDEYVGSNNQ